MSMTLMRSLPKASVPITFYPPPPERDMDNARLSITSLRTPEEASLEWSSREIASRHHFIIWPIAAVLLSESVRLRKASVLRLTLSLESCSVRSTVDGASDWHERHLRWRDALWVTWLPLKGQRASS